jgi:hypothetical protein
MNLIVSTPAGQPALQGASLQNKHLDASATASCGRKVLSTSLKLLVRSSGCSFFGSRLSAILSSLEFLRLDYSEKQMSAIFSVMGIKNIFKLIQYRFFLFDFVHQLTEFQVAPAARDINVYSSDY